MALSVMRCWDKIIYMKPFHPLSLVSVPCKRRPTHFFYLQRAAWNQRREVKTSGVCRFVFRRDICLLAIVETLLLEEITLNWLLFGKRKHRHSKKIMDGQFPPKRSHLSMLLLVITAYFQREDRILQNLISFDAQSDWRYVISKFASMSV